MKNSISYLESELNKIFESLDTTSCIKVSFILSKLDLSNTTNIINQRQSKFSPESLLKVYLWKKIKGVRFYHKALDQITEEEALHLGFYKENNTLVLPAKSWYNRFFQNKVDENLFLELNNIVKLILKTATKKGIILDLELVKNAVNQKNKEAKEQRKIKKETIKLVKKLIYPQIDIKIKNNGKFTTKDLLDVLVHVAQTHDFAHNGTETFKELNSESKCPSSWTMLYHFNKFNNKIIIQEMFDKVFDTIFNFAKRNYRGLRRRQLDIAIDIHKIPYYGNKNDNYVLEGKLDRGTTHFHQFITCSIVVAGRRFTIDAILMHKLDNLEDLVDKIIKRVKEKINIDKAYLDRGFDKPKVINVLKANRVKFVMPKVRSDRVKAWMDKSLDCKARIIKDFEFGKKEKAKVNLILVDDEEGIQRAFITNFDIPEQLSHYLYTWYSKRWGIETGYRQLDHDFKARTTSKNYLIRLFYFLFSVCLYNLWVLVNICISLSIYGRIRDKPIITAKLFSVILYRVVYEDPPT
ncbi:MAG: transposase [Candidatus Woesearchaeota archaeon]